MGGYAQQCHVHWTLSHLDKHGRILSVRMLLSKLLRTLLRLRGSICQQTPLERLTMSAILMPRSVLMVSAEPCQFSNQILENCKHSAKLQGPSPHVSVATNW